MSSEPDKREKRNVNIKLPRGDQGLVSSATSKKASKVILPNHFCLETSDRLREKYHLSSEEVENTLKIINNLVNSYHMHGMPANLVGTDKWNSEEYIKTKEKAAVYKAVHLLLKFQQGNPTCKYAWVKLFKWKLASFLCLQIGNPIKDPPDLNYGHSESKDILFRADGLLGGIFHDALEHFYAEWKRSEVYEVDIGPSMGLSRNLFASQRWGDFLATINILKKGMPKVPQEMLRDELKETLVILKTEYAPSDDIKVLQVPTFVDESESAARALIEARSTSFAFLGSDSQVFDHILNLQHSTDFRYDPTTIKDQAREAVRELFRGSVLSRKDYYTPSFPSTSANQQDTREAGGSVNSVKSNGDVLDLLLINDLTGRTLLDTGVKPAEFQGKLSEHYGELGKAEQETFDNLSIRYQYVETYQGSTNVLDVSDLEAFITPLRDTIFQAAMDESPYAEPVVLSEPFKARIITKGQPMTQYALGPIQKKMHSTLRRYHQFKFIGQPIDDEEMINFLTTKLGRGQKWVSGDYKASTNYLRSWLTNAIWDEIVDLWERNDLQEFYDEKKSETEFRGSFYRDLKILGFRALTGHKIADVHNFFGEGFWLDQKNGQLMGSIISFPILCIANAILCQMSINADRQQSLKPPLSILQCPFFINGDDCLLPLSDFGYQCWYQITKEGGLESSVGKTYFSDEYVTLNSTLYMRVPRTNFWIRTKGINFGILYGQARSSNKTNEKRANGTCDGTSLGQLGVLLRKLKDDSPSYLWKDVKALFIKYHGEQLRNCGIPWFLPEWCGGLGFPIDDIKEVSIQDLHAASLIKLHKVKFPKLSNMKEWKLHDLVNQQLTVGEQPFKYIIDRGYCRTLEECYEENYSWLIFDTFLRKPLESLRILSSKQLDHKGLKETIAIRNRINKKMFKEQYELITLDELQQEQKVFYPPILRSEYSFELVE